MAIIFYWTSKGIPRARPIYGVHPDTNIEVPDGVVSMATPEAPDKIAWPVPSGYKKGKEQWSVVDTTGTEPVLATDFALVPPKAEVSVEELITQMIKDGTMTQEKINTIKTAR